MRRGQPVLASSLTRLLRERRDGKPCVAAPKARHSSPYDAPVVEDCKQSRRKSAESVDEEHSLPSRPTSRHRNKGSSAGLSAVIGQSLHLAPQQDYGLPRLVGATSEELLLGPGGSRPASRHRRPSVTASSSALSSSLSQPLPVAGTEPSDRPQSTASQQDSRLVKNVEDPRRQSKSFQDEARRFCSRALDAPRLKPAASSPALTPSRPDSSYRERQIPIDGQTLVPASLFEALSLAGKRARERGQHRLHVSPRQGSAWSRPGSSCGQGPRKRLVHYSG